MGTLANVQYDNVARLTPVIDLFIILRTIDLSRRSIAGIADDNQIRNARSFAPSMSGSNVGPRPASSTMIMPTAYVSHLSSSHSLHLVNQTTTIMPSYQARFIFDQAPMTSATDFEYPMTSALDPRYTVHSDDEIYPHLVEFSRSVHRRYLAQGPQPRQLSKAELRSAAQLEKANAAEDREARRKVAKVKREANKKQAAAAMKAATMGERVMARSGFITDQRTLHAFVSKKNVAAEPNRTPPTSNTFGGPHEPTIEDMEDGRPSSCRVHSSRDRRRRLRRDDDTSDADGPHRPPSRSSVFGESDELTAEDIEGGQLVSCYKRPDQDMVDGIKRPDQDMVDGLSYTELAELFEDDI